MKWKTRLNGVQSLRYANHSYKGVIVQEYREEKMKSFSQFERVATSCLSLGNETVNMLKYITDELHIINFFMEPYIVERFAAMVDYNLTALVGPRCTDLKV
jgi:ubiquitin conjugation factor E4 B